jgi:uncharacterized coiled-coil protein SlyX
MVWAMNDPLNIDRPGGFRNAVYGMMGSMFIFVITTIWYGSQIEARFDARINSLEKQQSISQTVIDKLNDAREESRVHGAQVDAKLSDVAGKLSTILEIVQQDTALPPESGGIQNGGPENFQPPQKGRGR